MADSTFGTGVIPHLSEKGVLRLRRGAAGLLVAVLALVSSLAAQSTIERPRIPAWNKSTQSPQNGPGGSSGQAAPFRLWLSEDASAQTPAGDAATAIAGDSSGNVFVAGWSDRAEGGRDMLLLKYDPHGNRLWQVGWNSAENLDDYPLLLAVDRQGNCLLSGFSSEHNGSERVQLLKFGSAGKLVWQQSISAEPAQRPVALQIDEDGNYLLAVNSLSLQSGADILLQCYSPAGRELWSRAYSSSGYRTDAVTAMVQSDGHIYLSGYSEFNRRGMDFLLLCYSRSGELLWQRLHDAGQQLDNQAVALAPLPQGGVLLAGTAQLTESASAYAVVAYGDSGERLFERLYHSSTLQQPRLTGLQVDSEGQFRLVGYGQGGARSAVWLLGCDRAGMLLWQKDWYGSGSESLFPVALRGGRRNGFLLSVNSDGGAQPGFYTAGYSAGGSLQWKRSYAPGRGFSDAVALTTGAAGPVCVTGYTRGDSTGWDIVTVSYLPDGRDNWQSVYTSPPYSSNILLEMLPDVQGNLVSLGTSMDGNNRRIARITCHNTHGALRWQQSVSAGEGGDLLHPGLLPHPREGVFFFGIMRKSGRADQVLLIHLLADGSQASRQSCAAGYPLISGLLGCAGSEGELFLAVASGEGSADGAVGLLCRTLSGELSWKNLPQGNYRSWVPLSMAAGDGYVAIAGSALNGAGERDYLTLLSAGNGDPLWANSYAGAAAYTDEAVAVQFVPGKSDLVVTGNSYESGFNRDITTLCYSADGALLWQQHYDGNGHNNEAAVRLVTHADGSLLVGADGYGNAGGQELLLLCYSSSGDLQWESRYGAGASAWYQLQDLHATTRGIYAAASSRTGRGLAQVLLKLDNGGNLQWQQSSLAEPGVSLLPGRIRASAAGEFFVAGSRTRGYWSVMQLAGYRENSVISGLSAAPAADIKHQAYPNPFNPQTTISFTLRQAGQVDLRIYTILGRKVAQLASGRYAAGEYQFVWDAAEFASGVYLYRLQTGAQQSSGRLLLLR